MRPTPIIILLFLGNWLVGQSFQEIPHYNAFINVGDGTMVARDFNGDSIPDLLVGGRKSKLFLNNGLGEFTEGAQPPFESVTFSHMAVDDVNGDHHLDAIITGLNKDKNITTKLYFGDGNGNFTVVKGTSFLQAEFGSVTIADINGDQFPDLILTGRIRTKRYTKLYTNDGYGNFAEVMDTPFEGVDFASVVVKDVNGDGYPDIFISGDTGIVLTSKGPIDQYARTSKLYINDGQGNFSLKKETPFIGIFYGDVEIEDLNGDDYPDIVMVGEKYINSNIARIYLNDSVGNFTEKMDISLVGITDGDIDVGDTNGDGHPDIIVSGKSDWKTAICNLYLNDGTGNFTLKKDTPFIGLAKGSTILKDVNGDQLLDVIMNGSMFRQYMKLYINNGKGHFTERIETPFFGMCYGFGAIADLNNDGQKDILLNGSNNFSKKISQIYLGERNDQYRAHTDTILLKASDSSFAIRDINGDSYPDVFISGSAVKSQPTSKLFLNDSLGHFTEARNTSFDGVTKGAVAIADLNGDSFPDILFTGYDSSRVRITRLYQNDGQAGFSRVENIPFEGMRDGSIDIHDMNGDGSPDVFITGEADQFMATAMLYLNDGVGNFTEVKDAPFVGVVNSSVAIADINHDGTPDVLIAGRVGFNNLYTKLYVNSGSGIFKEVENTAFEGIYRGAIAMTDINGDSHPDVLLTGITKTKEPTTKLYTNDGKGNFTEVKNTPFAAVQSSSIAIDDINNDKLPDILLTGNNGAAKITRLYINTTEVEENK